MFNFDEDIGFWESLKDNLIFQKDWIKDSYGEKTWQDFYDSLKDNENYIVDVIKNTDDLSKLTGDDLVQANQKARTSALAHNEAIKAQTLSAKAGKAALQTLATAGNIASYININNAKKDAENRRKQKTASPCCVTR